MLKYKIPQIVTLTLCFPLQPMLTKCGHFLILKQENRKSFLLAICGFFLVIPLRFGI